MPIDINWHKHKHKHKLGNFSTNTKKTEIIDNLSMKGGMVEKTEIKSGILSLITVRRKMLEVKRWDVPGFREFAPLLVTKSY